MQGAAIVEEQQAANTANGQADGMLAPPIEAQGRPEMSTRPSHVQQTMPNGQVGYVRQDSARGPSRGSQREYMLLNLAPILLSIRLSQMPEDRILVLWLPLQRIDLRELPRHALYLTEGTFRLGLHKLAGILSGR